MRTWGLLLCVSLVVGVVHARAADSVGEVLRPAAFQPSCAALPPTPGSQGCGRPDCPHCGCQPPDQPRLGPPQDEERPRLGPPGDEEFRETGFYQAPPRSGGMQGPAQSLGLNLGTLVLPELRLRLPTIELPSCYRVRQQARMVLDAAHAPWVSTGFERGYSSGVAGYGPEAGSPPEPIQDRAAPEANCEGRRVYEEKIRELQRKIDECDQLKRSIQDQIDSHTRSLEEQTCPTPARNKSPVCPTPPIPVPDARHGTAGAGVQAAAYLQPVPAVRRLPRLPAAVPPRPFPTAPGQSPLN